jgi:tripartite-type tricarboxylate transporter receptor subunit TctC
MSCFSNTIAGAAAVLLVAAAPLATAHAGPVYDSKTVTLIVPNGPSGLMSQYAHMMAPQLAKHLGAKTVHVDNQPGGGGLRGTNNLARAKTDGTTIAFTGLPSLLVAALAKSPGVQFDPAKFVYLGRVSTDPRLMVVGKDSTIKSVDDIRKLGRPLTYASQGTDEDFYTMAIMADVLGYELKTLTGYEGAADTALAVVRGDADALAAGWPGVVGAVEGGDMRPIVFTTKERQSVAPDVPTVFEYVTDDSKKPALEAMVDILSLSRGFFGPPDMDPAAVAEMRAAIQAMLTDPAFVATLAERAMPVVFMPGEEQQQIVEKAFASGDALTPIFDEALAKIQ